MTTPKTIPADEARVMSEPGTGVAVTKAPQTKAGTQQGDYKTEFVKVYQDAGVIGVAMITLLALCLLMGFFSMRILKMYVALTESRDKLEGTRTEVQTRIAENLIALKGGMAEVITELRSDHGGQTVKLDQIVNSLDRNMDKLDRISERNMYVDRHTADRETQNDRHRDNRESNVDRNRDSREAKVDTQLNTREGNVDRELADRHGSVDRALTAREHETDRRWDKDREVLHRDDQDAREHRDGSNREPRR